MTLKRLAILLAILIFLAGVGIAWLWQYAYTPQGRARVIIAQIKDDSGTPPSTLRGWMVSHHMVRQGFKEPPEEGNPYDLDAGVAFYLHREDIASDEMVRVGQDVLPLVIEALQDNNRNVRLMAIWACRKFRDPAAVQPLMQVVDDTDEFVRENAALALGEMKDKRAIPAVRRLLNDPAYGCRRSAAEALKNLGEKPPLGWDPASNP
jgi:hypothetical protein